MTTSESAGIRVSTLELFFDLVAVAQPAAIPLIMAAGAIAEDLPRIRRLGMAEAIGDFGRNAGQVLSGDPPDRTWIKRCRRRRSARRRSATRH
ncbi:hypothetical protein KZ829_23620 [Actinoplanes hulinensis]|uniref:Uncharacterized protein n=1 Tax=Actinoplanes hulinensis TaxID=1144547 RepID=A0ABS7B6S3_9ACTN|nr:hypothetical protein [Actinoplanes hulinensis]MBW6436735.1 hypothetical protein [Actinoplanes hulinensis]